MPDAAAPTLHSSAMKNLQVMDGCTAAAHVAYALSEVATIYPITPIASMGETADKWARAGRKNLMGSPMTVKEMESELGAAGATHGALAVGSLATTFTSSQGLMLMIPNMYKIAGEQLPAVFHVGTRSLATQALSIFGDHQDVMACRATGFAMLASASVQETMDLALVAHLAAISGSMPVIHFFDGWRTSNETATIDVIPYEAMRPLVDREAVARFRARGLNPDHPSLRGSAQNSDVYFQNREAVNSAYLEFPAKVRQAMEAVASVTGRRYGLVDYVGAPDATDVTVAIGSACEVIEETVGHLNTMGYKAGLVKIRLYRPFPAGELIAALPQSVKRIAVLDRTKEPGSSGEPLFQDVATAVLESGRQLKVIGGRYGLSSKEFDPVMVKAVYDEMLSASPRRRFTVGIDDDVTHLSLDISAGRFVTAPEDVAQCVFYGMGSDGTVGSTRQIASIITAVSGSYVQAAFNYSAKKSGGYTISELRYGPAPIRSEYAVYDADYVGVNKDVYVRRFRVADPVRKGGILVINSSWTPDDYERELPASLKREIAAKQLRLYNVDARSLAERCGLGVRINTIMATVMMRLMDSAMLPFAKAVAAYRQTVTDTYMHEGAEVVHRNLAAIDGAVSAIRQIQYPASWAVASDGPAAAADVPAFVRDVAEPCLRLLGNELPVSAFTPDGTMPMGTTAYEKRCIADNIPAWDAQKCVQCTECSLVCAHAAIRPYLLTAAEAAGAPEGFTTVDARGIPAAEPLKYRIQVYPDDCTGCGSCAVICPGHALTMTPIAGQAPAERPMLVYAQTKVTEKQTEVPRATVRGSQLRQPLLQFSGACAGCGETPYVKLLTQLFGERMVIANATGCSSIWGANYPSNAYCINSRGKGPAWGNSLFEDNAEFGLGMHVGVEKLRDRIQITMEEAIANCAKCSEELKGVMKEWIENRGSSARSAEVSARLVPMMEACGCDYCKKILEMKDWLVKKSQWIIGGDGWGYDIGYGGVDHVLASGQDVNILVIDTEVYSNTGGQSSKATPVGAIAKFASSGKRIRKKDLGAMAMTYGYVYVAQVSIGASQQQLFNVLKEAEAYPGPSLVIAYAPCINHGIKGGMSRTQTVGKEAVACGYWHLWHYNPQLEEQGKNPFVLDSKEPDWTKFQDFLKKEVRYTSLQKMFPGEAEELFQAAEQNAKWRYNGYRRLAAMEY